MNEINISNLLQRYLPKVTDIPNELLASMKVQNLPKGKVLIKEGRILSKIYYVIKGGARSYYLKDGIEICSWFGFEKDILGSLQSFAGKGSLETIELLEDSQLIEVDLNKVNALLNTNLAANIFVRKLIEEHALFLEERIYHLQFMTAMDRYVMLLDNEPELFQRVSLTYIASYLGIRRETLSRLRAK